MVQPAPRLSALPRERGAALWLVLLALMLAAGYGLPLASNALAIAIRRQNDSEMALQQARDALIARAVNDDNRPGSLPCPDLLTDDAGLRNRPDDGKADNLTRNQCPSAVGRLPWVTLKLPELRDAADNRLWYVVAPGLYDDDSTPAINSDSDTGLTLDGTPQIAALLIAPGAALAGQQRPSNNPADYLDGENGNGDDQRYARAVPGSNDRILALPRAMLMAAVERRVAGEVRACLRAHGSAPGTTDYPWPAPLSSSQLQGLAGSRFGRLPLTQPEAGVGVRLASQASALANSRQTLLAAAPFSNAQLNALAQLGEIALTWRNFSDSLFSVANRLAQQASQSKNSLNTLSATIGSAASNNRISRSEGQNIGDQAASTNTALAELPALLAASGLDPLPDELARQNQFLLNATTLMARQQSACSLDAWLSLGSNSHPEIAAPLGAAQSASRQACASNSSAAQGLSDPAEALAASQMATLTVNRLLTAISASRVPLLAADLSVRHDALAAANNADEVRAQAGRTQTLLTRIADGPAAILAARDGIQTQLSNLLSQASLPAQAPDELLAPLAQLAQQLQDNESADNNLTRSSLQALLGVFKQSYSTFLAIDRQEPRPLQQAIVPYANDLDTRTRQLQSLGSLIASHGDMLARQARSAPLPTGGDPSSAPILADSLRAAADKLVNTLSSAEQAVQAAIKQPSASRQQNAATALALLQSNIATLQAQLPALGSQLASSTRAAAWPMVWQSARCDFLRPDANSWWQHNRWSDSLFYQIADRQPGARPHLRVNGHQQLDLVVVAAGGALPGQVRSSGTLAAFLEGDNADPTRSGNALAPSPVFVELSRSTVNNDRFSY